MVEIEIEIEGVIAVATLLEDAPRTCEEILKVLPIESEAFHNYWAGEGIFIPETHSQKIKSLNIPIENRTVYPSRGDVAFSTPGFKEINIIYGRGQFRGPNGDQPNNIFATITQNLVGFQKVCKKIHLEGTKNIVIRKRKG
jgi:hypothetical protein